MNFDAPDPLSDQGDGYRFRTRRRWRLRRTLKWVCAGGCAMIMSLALMCFVFESTTIFLSQNVSLVLARGTCTWRYFDDRTSTVEFQPPGGSVFLFDRSGIGQPTWASCFGLPAVLRRDRLFSVSLPLWIPFVPILTLTLWCWWRDRRRQGICRDCDYNLTGNLSGTCPECGLNMIEATQVLGRRRVAGDATVNQPRSADGGA